MLNIQNTTQKTKQNKNTGSEALINIIIDFALINRVGFKWPFGIRIDFCFRLKALKYFCLTHEHISC